MTETRRRVLESVSLGPTTINSLFVGLTHKMRTDVYDALVECVEAGAITKDPNGHPDLNLYSITAIGRKELRK